ncbi:SMC-Scp complex subunit ScpB [Hydrocarboniphaga effusa]|uniref:SMC-Scp complex subunit ScpB n=1 Tax=Hydrocarboniphaga effusa TaxID=243629 RepID=UPI0031382C37
MSDTPRNDEPDEEQDDELPEVPLPPEELSGAKPDAQSDQTAIADIAPEIAADATAQDIVTGVADNAEAIDRLEHIIEALLLAADGPLSVDALHRLLGEDLGIGRSEVRAALAKLDARLQGGAAQLQEVASGWRIQVREEYAGWVARLWQEKPPKFSRALLETLALVVYRQPITRGEIEEVRGVSVSSNILRTLQERGWVKEIGVKEVPGRPALFGTTAQFLDDFNLRTLDQLPSLPEIRDMDQLDAALAQLTGELPSKGDEAESEHEVDEAASESPEARDAVGDESTEDEAQEIVETIIDEGDERDADADPASGHAAPDTEDTGDDGAPAEEPKPDEER